MKKITLLVLFAIAFSTAAIAQFEAKKIAIGGNFGIDFQQVKVESGSTAGNVEVTVLPELEGFLTSKFSIGGSIGYQGSFPIGDENTKVSISSFTIGPYVKQYFSMGDYVAFFLKENLDMAVTSVTTKTKYEDHDTSVKATGFGVGLGVSPGFAVKLSPKVMFETSCGLFGLSMAAATSNDVTVTQTNISFKVNLTAIQFGVKVIL